MGNCGGVAGATVVAQRILDAMAEPVIIAGQHLYPSASIGIAMADDPGEENLDEEIRTLLHRADTAMYLAKQQKPISTWQLHVPDYLPLR
jgi:GGDEF domain-containing protein